jgi:hypothetical protein
MAQKPPAWIVAAGVIDTTGAELALSLVDRRGQVTITSSRSRRSSGCATSAARSCRMTVGHMLSFAGRALYLQEQQNVDIIDRFPGFLGYAP